MIALPPQRVAASLSGLILVVLLLPLVLVAIMSFNPVPNLVFPPKGISFHWYANLLHTDQFAIGLGYSLLLGAASTAIGFVSGTAASYAIVRHRFPGRDLLNAVLMSPLIIPEVVIGIGLLVLFSASVGGVGTGSLVALHSLIVLPYVVRVISANLMTADANLEDAALLLGASRMHAFVAITLPTIRKGIATAILFCLTISTHNFTATVFLITTIPTLPIAVYSYIATEGDPTIAALSTIVTALAVLIVWVIDKTLGVRRFAQ